MKPYFSTALDLRATVPGEWVLLAPLRYHSLPGLTVVAPAGFVTDLASIPRVARLLIDQNGGSRRAAVIHDWLYCSRRYPRAKADALFLEALEAEGVSWVVRRTMWAAVRAGGWMYWSRRDAGLDHDDFTDVG